MADKESLDNLPIEMILMICSQCELRSLHGLSLASKKLNLIVTGIFWKAACVASNLRPELNKRIPQLPNVARDVYLKRNALCVLFTPSYGYTSLKQVQQSSRSPLACKSPRPYFAVIRREVLTQYIPHLTSVFAVQFTLDIINKALQSQNDKRALETGVPTVMIDSAVERNMIINVLTL